MAHFLARGQAEAGEQAAEVLAFLERDPPPVDLGDVADDGQAEAGSGHVGDLERSAGEGKLRGLATALRPSFPLDSLRMNGNSTPQKGNRD